MGNPTILTKLACMLLITICTGCGNTNKKAPTPVKADEAQAADQVIKTPLTTMGTWKDIETLIQADRGKVVVVDIWSTYCAPCMKEFPRLLDLQKLHGDKLRCVSFNINYAGLPNQTVETDLPYIHKFLAKQQFQLTNIVSTETDEQVYAQLKIYSIPAILVFDKTGKRVATVMEEAAYETTVSPLVAQLLGE
ncbi:MAG: TlpA disulfide reductase family protein [Planctomycetota bacterium]|nr:TlpA disulfide reductase family protein [Planctomycetota bacterium]